MIEPTLCVAGNHTSFNYLQNGEQHKFCIGIDSGFLIEMLVILAIIFLQLNSLNKVISLFFVDSTVCHSNTTVLCLISIAILLLYLFFKINYAAKIMKRTWFNGANGQLVDSSCNCKHNPLIVLGQP